VGCSGLGCAAVSDVMGVQALGPCMWLNKCQVQQGAALRGEGHMLLQQRAVDAINYQWRCSVYRHCGTGLYMLAMLLSVCMSSACLSVCV
jgi:hypothetical protein